MRKLKTGRKRCSTTKTRYSRMTLSHAKRLLRIYRKIFSTKSVTNTMRSLHGLVAKLREEDSMQKIKCFDRSTARILKTRLESGLKKAEEKYGVTFSIGSIRFSQTEATFKITASVGNEEDLFKSALKAISPTFHDDKISELSELFHYGKTYITKGKTYRIVGLNLKAKKYPVIVEECESKQRYKCSFDHVLFYIKDD